MPCHKKSLENLFEIKTKDEVRPDLKIGWFAVTQPGPQEKCRSIFFFMFINLKKIFLLTNLL